MPSYINAARARSRLSGLAHSRAVQHFIDVTPSIASARGLNNRLQLGCINAIWLLNRANCQPRSTGKYFDYRPGLHWIEKSTPHPPTFFFYFIIAFELLEWKKGGILIVGGMLKERWNRVRFNYPQLIFHWS